VSFIAANKVYTNTNKTTIGVWDKATLRAPLSGTFLQTARFSYATEGATLYFRAAVQRRGQRPPKGLGTDMTVEAT